MYGYFVWHGICTYVCMDVCTVWIYGWMDACTIALLSLSLYIYIGEWTLQTNQPPSSACNTTVLKHEVDATMKACDLNDMHLIKWNHYAALNLLTWSPFAKTFYDSLGSIWVWLFRHGSIGFQFQTRWNRMWALPCFTALSSRGCQWLPAMAHILFPLQFPAKERHSTGTDMIKYACHVHAQSWMKTFWCWNSKNANNNSK